MNKNTFIVAFLFLFFGLQLQAQPAYVPSKENMEARAWFQDAKYGMFIHWGLSSVLGDGEWVMNSRKITVQDYSRLLDIFNPVQFDAKKWVSLAKNNGMKYITFVTRHHDGFSNWDTQLSDWKITNTPYGKDVLKELADECREQDVKLFLYYSLVDWYRSDYPHETGRTGKSSGRTGKGDYADYLNFMKGQLTELLTNYGEVAGVWFDGHWDQTNVEGSADMSSRLDWKYDEIYGLIHKLQPHCLIGNNHHLEPFPGEDFQMFERDLPGENKSGFSFHAASEHLPLETCETINKSWGYRITDNNYKSPRELVHLLVRAAGYGANLLLNIGPLPNGAIQPEFVTRLDETGAWLKTYGETIYGTSAGAVKPQSWGAITQKGNRVFIHVLDKKDDYLFVQLPYKFSSAKYFINNKKVNFQSLKDNFYMIDLKDCDNSLFDNVIELQIKK